MASFLSHLKMSVLIRVTLAMKMQFVEIGKELSNVHVKPDILETVSFVKISMNALMMDIFVLRIRTVKILPVLLSVFVLREVLYLSDFYTF